jgi:hypothetical protein
MVSPSRTPLASMIDPLALRKVKESRSPTMFKCWSGARSTLPDELEISPETASCCTRRTTRPSSAPSESPGMVSQTPAQPVYPFPAAAPETGPQDGSTESTWNALAAALGQQVRSAGRNGRRGAVPLGRWLAEDMILEAYEASGAVYSRGAVTLGIPESTFRRKAARILGHSESGLLPRSADWSNIRPLIAAWLRSDLTDNENRLDMLRNELLARVAEQSGDQTSLAAALMGVTAATYRSWLEKLPQTLPVPCP